MSAHVPHPAQHRSSGAELIAAERLRQMEVEGWTPEHDAHHDRGELLDAASAYISASRTCPPARWPWEFAWWKPSADPVRNLVKAGALIAAEIDRMQDEACALVDDLP